MIDDEAVAAICWQVMVQLDAEVRFENDAEGVLDADGVFLHIGERVAAAVAEQVVVCSECGSELGGDPLAWRLKHEGDNFHTAEPIHQIGDQS